MNATIDNQQVTLHQLAWLAGIWDGEGTFMIYKHEYKSKKGLSLNRFIGRITLTNSSAKIINEISSIFDYYKIKGHIYQESRRSKKHKECFHITINRMEYVKKAIKLMLPYLIFKKEHAEILLKFIEERMKYKAKVIQDKKTGRIIGNEIQGFDSIIPLYEELKKLNAFGREHGTPQTIRQTSCFTVKVNQKT